MSRIHVPVTLQQAVQDSPTLARLTHIAQQSRQMLQAVQPLLPPALRQAIQPGPVDEQGWCLLVHSSAAAAKLRQLLPALQARLSEQGWQVSAIRVKIQSTESTARR